VPLEGNVADDGGVWGDEGIGMNAWLLDHGDFRLSAVND
jgi:hypothetical protein